jgi:hypothetical protein
MVSCNGSQPLRKQVVEGVARTDFDYFTLLAKVLNIVDEKEFNPTTVSLGKPFRTFQFWSSKGRRCHDGFLFKGLSEVG